MKQFLKKTSLFLIAVMAVLLLLLGISGWYVNRKEFFRLPAAKKYVVFGHSHTANAFNDSIMPEVYNAAEAMEGYLYTYGKIRKITEANPHIKTIFLEVTNNQFGYYAESRLWGEYMAQVYPKHFFTMDWRSHILLFRKEPMKALDALPLALKSNLEFILTGKKDYIDFRWSVDAIPEIASYKKVENPDPVFASTTGTIAKQYNVCQENLWYLAKIAKYCKDNKINLIFVRSPLAGFADQERSDSRFSEILENEFKDIPFMDFGFYRVMEDECCDIAHLNKKGSIRFSRMFTELLANGILNDSNMQATIDLRLQVTTPGQ